MSQIMPPHFRPNLMTVMYTIYGQSGGSCKKIIAKSGKLLKPGPVQGAERTAAKALRPPEANEYFEPARKTTKR